MTSKNSTSNEKPLSIFGQPTDSFFEERWREKKNEENMGTETTVGVSAETEEIDNKHEDSWQIYLEMTEGIDDDKELLVLLDDLKKAIIRYATCVIISYRTTKSEHVVTEAKSRQDMENSDQVRRLAHNNLVDSLSVLSRAYVKKKGVAMWRQKIDEGRGDRDRIAKWAKDVAPFILENKTL